MRWDELFAQFEAEYEAEFASDEQESSEAEILELLEAEMTSIRLVDRLAGHVGARVGIRLHGGHDRQGQIAEVNGAWVMLHDEHRRFLIPHPAIAHVRGLGPTAQPLVGIRAKLTLGHGLRAIARDGGLIQVTTASGAVRGRIGLIGADFCELVDAGARLSLAWGAILEVQPLR